MKNKLSTGERRIRGLDSNILPQQVIQILVADVAQLVEGVISELCFDCIGIYFTYNLSNERFVIHCIPSED
jgi:hypothetical protein